ncbi:MAG TPA: hypothetical protein PK725_01045 [Rhodocyclaceae bacterium]|nr:hypothetical protein [Rhodocyclaceae bacterium]HRQ45500.1 hypothetical protein [Rhodocyclaceae bacterium]
MTDPIEAHSSKRVVPFYSRWHFWLTALATLATLYGGWRWMVTPHVNPHPQKKVVVRGVFPYERGWELKALMNFYTHNPYCQTTARVFLIFPMAQVSRAQRVDIAVTREGANRYSLIYYQDHFLPGWCEWRFGGSSPVILVDGQSVGGGGFGDDRRNYHQVNYECHYIEYDLPRVKEKHIVCGDDSEQPHQHDPERTDKESNFVWKNKVLYTHLVSPGHSETIWKEGEEE